MKYGEECDSRYAEIKSKLKTFAKQEHEEVSEIQRGYKNIKIKMAETLKNVIVDIEDHVLRDQVLSLLTEINSSPLEKSMSQILEKLVQRVRDVFLKNKRLNEIN